MPLFPQIYTFYVLSYVLFAVPSFQADERIKPDVSLKLLTHFKDRFFCPTPCFYWIASFISLVVLFFSCYLSLFIFLYFLFFLFSFHQLYTHFVSLYYLQVFLPWSKNDQRIIFISIKIRKRDEFLMETAWYFIWQGWISLVLIGYREEATILKSPLTQLSS